MDLCSYNIQYGIGKDGKCDLKRIAREIGSPDIITLQEVERYFPETGAVDQVAEIAKLFPTYHWVFGPGVDIDADIVDKNGHVTQRRRQFGNMILSRYRIQSSRNHLLPKHGLFGPLSLQRSLLEAVVNPGTSLMRIYSTHLAHASSDERCAQVKVLASIVKKSAAHGGAWSGEKFPSHWADACDTQVFPASAVVMGDFNMLGDSPEYEDLAGKKDKAHGRLTQMDGLVDAWEICSVDAEETPTCLELARGDRRERSVRLDYAFVTTDLVSKVANIRVDQEALGSDHQPIFLHLKF